MRAEVIDALTSAAASVLILRRPESSTVVRYGFRSRTARSGTRSGNRQLRGSHPTATPFFVAHRSTCSCSSTQSGFALREHSHASRRTLSSAVFGPRARGKPAHGELGTTLVLGPKSEGVFACMARLRCSKRDMRPRKLQRSDGVTSAPYYGGEGGGD